MLNPLRKDRLNPLVWGLIMIVATSEAVPEPLMDPDTFPVVRQSDFLIGSGDQSMSPLQKGGVPAAPSGTATLLRLSPSHRFYLRALLTVAHFRHSRLPWLDGRCVQGPGTYSPRHG